MAERFIGRDRELAELRAQLAGGRLMTIAGVGGAGKSALLRQFLREATEDGWVVGTGRSYEAGGTLPYWPWVEVFSALPGVVGNAEALFESGAEGADIAETAAFRFLERVVTGLIEMSSAAGGHVLLAFEDLHWADASCLVLLRQMLRRPSPGLAFAATLRPAEAARLPLLVGIQDEVSRDGRLTEIRVPAFSIEESARIVQDIAGPAVADAEVARLHRRSGGNAFFLVELARAWASGTSIDGLPPSIGHVLAARMSRLPAGERAMLDASAVIGLPVPVSVIAEMAGVAAGEADSCTAHLMRIGLLDGGKDGYRAAHDLVQEAALESMDAVARERLHGRAVVALERIDASPADLAAHALRAGAPARDGRAYRYCLRAAEAARRAFAFEDAARWYGAAADVASGGGGDCVAALLAAGAASHHAGREESALQWYAAAFDAACALEDSAGAAEAAIGFEDAFLAGEFSRDDRRPIRLLTAALSALHNSRDSLRVRLSAALARARFFAGEHQAGLDLAAAALEAARATDDASAIAYALHAHRIAAWAGAPPEERLAMATALRDTANKVGAQELAMEGRQWRYYALLESGSDAAAGALVEYEDAAHEFRAPAFLYKSTLWHAMSMVAAGEFSAATPIIERARRLVDDADSRAIVVDADLLSLTLALASGTEADSIARFAQYVAAYPALPMFRFILGRLEATAGSPAEARRLVEAGFTGGLRGLANDHFRLIALVFLGETAAALADRDLSSTAAAALEPYAGRVATVPPVMAGAVDATRARLSRGLGDAASAERQYRRALDTELALGATAFAARTAAELGGLLSSAGGQRDETSRLFSMAAALAARFDPPGSRHVAAAIDSVGWSHAASRPARLSAREAEVLQLLADGLTNREIADRLVLSERTVDRHVANAYTKIGAHSRAEATRFAVEYLH